MPITHPFSSAKSDGADATLVRPSNWNAAHTVTDLAYSGYLRLGSASAPSNALSGDFTAVQAFIPTIYGSPTNASGGTLTLISTSHATKGFTYIGAAATFAVDEVNARVGIGRAAPDARLDVAYAAGAAISSGSPWLHMRALDTTAFAAGVGGAISFAGYYNATPTIGHFGIIKGYKLNATSGNAAGGLQFAIGDGSAIVEVMRIHPLSGGGILAVNRAGYTVTDYGQDIEAGRAVAAGTNYLPLVLRNNTGATVDTRVGIFFQTNSLTTKYGPAIIARNDGITGDGDLIFASYANDVFTEKMRMYYDGSLTVGAPTGGAKGIGTINAKAFYDDNVAVTDHVFDAYLDRTLIEAHYEERLRPWVNQFNTMWLDPEVYEGTWRRDRRLPLMHDSLDNRGSVGETINVLTLNLELQAIHMATLRARIAALEAARNN